MRILVLLSRVPYPLEKGDKLRAFNQIRELSKKNELILCALNPSSNLDKQKAFSELQPYCHSINFLDLPVYSRLWNMAMAFFGNIPIQAGYFYNRNAVKEINRLIESYKPDHIYCQFIRTTEYVKNISIKKTLDYQDVLSHGIKRRLKKVSIIAYPFLKMEYKRLIRYEGHIFDYFDNKTIISIPDKNLIHHDRKEEIHVIPNGVDHSYFSPINKEKTFDVVFTGNMAYPPNVDASVYLIKEIMPLVWKKIPIAKVLLAGASPVKKVLSLKSKNVKVSGWMDDIRDSYSAAKVFIAPMRIGTGLQNKLLEAMSMKIPSVTTPMANDALQAKEGSEILIGGNAQELANSITELLSDENLYHLIAQNGYNFVHNNYSWESATEKLNEIINNT
ncbi:MAG: glycosyltransferase [Bacteroidetes bacterium]|nr:glycosyltransferase [Bacteroidota bacterium]MBL6943430.1 glycosyltransferase [Bacteroidales bacterium]